MQNAILKNIETLQAKHDNTIAIFGGAYHVNRNDMVDITSFLVNVVTSARFLKWHESDASACRTFCHLALIDPALVEAAIGMTFEKLVSLI